MKNNEVYVDITDKVLTIYSDQSLRCSVSSLRRLFHN